MDRRVVNVLRHMPERNRFLRGMIPWLGFRQIGIPYQRKARFAGESKFSSVRQMLPFALDAITSFSYLPLQLATYLGFSLAALSGLAIIVVILLRLLGPSNPLAGQATTLVIVLFLGRAADQSGDYWRVSGADLRRGKGVRSTWLTGPGN